MKIRQLGIVEYQKTWRDMQSFTDSRSSDTEDELWLLQHFPVFTQGLAGKSEHILRRSEIPIIRIDRGGQITYHGLGQIVMYTLLDLRPRNIGIRPLVSALENSVIQVLRQFDIKAEARRDAPGVYVCGKKIASLGLKIRHGCTYHGVALNVDMDLKPFTDINPCGLLGMKMTQVSDFQKNISPDAIGLLLANTFVNQYSQL